jgi:hypothetical protein
MRAILCIPLLTALTGYAANDVGKPASGAKFHPVKGPCSTCSKAPVDSNGFFECYLHPTSMQTSCSNLSVILYSDSSGGCHAYFPYKHIQVMDVFGSTTVPGTDQINFNIVKDAAGDTVNYTFDDSYGVYFITPHYNWGNGNPSNGNHTFSYTLAANQEKNVRYRFGALIYPNGDTTNACDFADPIIGNGGPIAIVP